MKSHGRTTAFALVIGLAMPASGFAQGAAYEQLQAFSGVLSHVRQNYVDSVEFGSLVQASIRGMLSSLDPHSHYVTRREFELEIQWNNGTLGDPGLYLDNQGRDLTVLSVTVGGAADRAGIEPGDRLIRVNDSIVVGLAARSVEARLRGAVGSTVRLTFERGNPLLADTLAVTLKRDAVDQTVVSLPRMINPHTGYIRLEQFTGFAPKQLVESIKQLRRKGARQLVLDLRGNPGGDMEAMVEIASLFLPKNSVVFRTQSRRPAAYPPVVTSEDGAFTKIPLSVLIDAGSASASEVLAGCLQDHDRALIIGQRSFGKGVIQTSLPLPNGDVVWLTTARIVTPSGRVVQRRYTPGSQEQYFLDAGRAGVAQDTTASYRTGRGRQVRGGGGVLPDVVRPTPSALPVWFSVAMDSGYGMVADSLGQTLPSDSGARVAWINDSLAWDTRLVSPFMKRVGSGLGIRPDTDPVLRARIGRILARRASLVRWGAEAAEDFSIHNDADIQAAAGSFGRIPELLGKSAPDA